MWLGGSHWGNRHWRLIAFLNTNYPSSQLFDSILTPSGDPRCCSRDADQLWDISNFNEAESHGCDVNRKFKKCNYPDTKSLIWQLFQPVELIWLPSTSEPEYFQHVHVLLAARTRQNQSEVRRHQNTVYWKAAVLQQRLGFLSLQNPRNTQWNEQTQLYISHWKWPQHSLGDPSCVLLRKYLSCKTKYPPSHHWNTWQFCSCSRLLQGDSLLNCRAARCGPNSEKSK